MLSAMSDSGKDSMIPSAGGVPSSEGAGAGAAVAGRNDKKSNEKKKKSSASSLDALLRRARSDRPEPLSERSLPTKMAQSFADQPWATVGLLEDDDGDILATSDFDKTVEQLSSILENRLAEIILKRKGENAAKRGQRAMWHSTSQLGLGTGGGGSRGAYGGAGRGGRSSSSSSTTRSFRRRRRLRRGEGGGGGGGSGNIGGSENENLGGSGGPFDFLPKEDLPSAADIVLSPACRSEVREYVRTIGSMYRDCKYHRFEHAAHVTASANKLVDMMEECEEAADEMRENDLRGGGGGGGGREMRAEFMRRDSTGSVGGDEDGVDRPLTEPACSYATGDPTVPTVHIDHPKLAETVRRMSDLHARRRGSAESNHSGSGGGGRGGDQGQQQPQPQQQQSRRDSMHSTATSGTDADAQEQMDQAASPPPPPQVQVHSGSSSGTGTGGGFNEGQFYFDMGQYWRYQQSPTFDIATDPLTKFAIVYAALVHDVDHQGVPNRQLVAEGDDLALLYNDKSVAEQHSLKVAFQTLMQPRFATFRHELIPTSNDQFTFRTLVIELVLCTDIASPERMQLAKSKWVEAFGELPKDDTADGVATVTASRPSVVSAMGGWRGTSQKRASIGVPGYAPSFYPSDGIPQQGGGGGMGGIGGGVGGGGGINAHHASQGRVVSGHQPGLQGGECLGIRRALHLNGSTIEFYAAPGDPGGTAQDGSPASVAPWAASLLAEKRLRSSVVLELLMNAADVAHTLQGWDNFLKWNRKLYEELFHAYHVIGRVQRGEADPAVDWYRNQLCFYDIYILPLARKLRRCGAFGRGGGRQIVRNAKAIRRRWEFEGADATERMIREVRERWEETKRGKEASLKTGGGANEGVRTDAAGAQEGKD
uniref:PDEase domain-containing protein n=1 Tax=Pseudictyota dubia TaxID=2749911 RepID=A0A7R9WN34_9STRA|mmetsp:Transcript_9662/g.18286  ORF Transcript_9662/g.18286 Transcript_9662/m.18286 type:complete len:878 (+) Transcript_9662:1160-3793(+)